MILKKNAKGQYVLRFWTNGRGSRLFYRNLGKIPYKEAAKKAAKEVAIEKARKSGDPDVTFGVAADRYLRTQGPSMSGRAKERAEGIIEKYLRPFFGVLKAEAIRPLDVEEYRRKRLAADPRPSPATVNREWATLKAVLNKAEAWGLIDRNPIRRGAVEALRESKGRLVFFEPEEWMQLVASFDDTDRWRVYVKSVTRLGPVKVGKGSPEERRYGGGRKPDSEATDAYLERLREAVPVLRVLLLTGSRLSEVLELRWADVDMKRKIVTIRQQKTDRPKTVPISTDLEALLKALGQGVGEAHVLRHKDGRPFYPMEVQRAFSVARKLAGVRRELTIHSLRHTFASWLAINGTPLRTIQELLGHADVRMTIRYSHLSPVHLKEAAETIGALIRERPENETSTSKSSA